MIPKHYVHCPDRNFSSTLECEGKQLNQASFHDKTCRAHQYSPVYISQDGEPWKIDLLPAEWSVMWLRIYGSGTDSIRTKLITAQQTTYLSDGNWFDMYKEMNNHETCAVMPMCTVDKYKLHWICSMGEKFWYLWNKLQVSHWHMPSLYHQLPRGKESILDTNHLRGGNIKRLLHKYSQTMLWQEYRSSKKHSIF